MNEDPPIDYKVEIDFDKCIKCTDPSCYCITDVVVVTNTVKGGVEYRVEEPAPRWLADAIANSAGINTEMYEYYREYIRDQWNN